MEQVSWNDCQGFIQRLNQLGQGTFRLPAEAEWEYACRAGTTTRFYWGDDPNSTEMKEYAWFVHSEIMIPMAAEEVGLKKPNRWGLFDMSGNVNEWCWDRFGSYSQGDQIDPTGPPDQQSNLSRVFRGGSWHDGYASCRSAIRGHPLGGPDQSGGHEVGFRIVLSPA